MFILQGLHHFNSHHAPLGFPSTNSFQPSSFPVFMPSTSVTSVKVNLTVCLQVLSLAFSFTHKESVLCEVKSSIVEPKKSCKIDLNERICCTLNMDCSVCVPEFRLASWNAYTNTVWCSADTNDCTSVLQLFIRLVFSSCSLITAQWSDQCVLCVRWFKCEWLVQTTNEICY